MAQVEKLTAADRRVMRQMAETSDLGVREEALRQALHHTAAQSRPSKPEEVVKSARVFEAYLRGKNR